MQVADAYLQFLYSNVLLLPCFCTGLLGGLVYVNAFTLIAKEVPPRHKEFSLAAASLADTLGIMLSDVTGGFIQRALYRYHGIQ